MKWYEGVWEELGKEKEYDQNLSYKIFKNKFF